MGERSERGARKSIAVLTLLAALVVAPAIALGPPPTPQIALWSGSDWGTLNNSQKIVNNGDTMTITANIVGGPPVGTYCGYGQWTEEGTGEVTIYIPVCFERVDYSPKADDLHNVDVESYWVTWTAVSPTATKPKPYYNAGCYCNYNGGTNNTRTYNCPEPLWKTGVAGAGASFSVTVKATTCPADTGWLTTSVDLAGNWGVPWWDSATDYYKMGGHASISLTANPTSLPAYGRQSNLVARVFEPNSGVNLPNYTVNFGKLFGWLEPDPVQTDSNGLASTFLAGMGVEGSDIVQASIPGAQDTATVQFTHVDKQPVNEDTQLGQLIALQLIGEPVHAGIGNYTFSKSLFGFPGKGLPFAFEVNYDSLDNLYSGPLGFGWTHTYNAILTPPVPPSNNVDIKWGDGHWDHFHGDGAGNFTPVNSNPGVTLTMPDPNHYLATLHNMNTYQFDSGGHLLAITDLDGNQIAITYSTTVPGEIDHITDTAGRQIAFAYVAGHITSITSPLKGGNTVAFQYDGLGNLTGIVDPRGKTWGFTYDGSHRVLGQIDAKGVTVVTNAYNGASGRIVQQTDGAGHITTYQYTVDTSSGTTTTITPPSGNAVTHVYDLAYNLVKVIDGEGHQATFGADSQGRVGAATDKKGNTFGMVYDANGNAIVAQDRTGAGSQFTFNAQNRPTAVTDPLNHTTSFGYDANGNLTGIWNANGDHLGVTVDASGLPTAISDFRSPAFSWSFAYDGSGLPQTVTDPNGAHTGLTHDAAGRLTQATLGNSIATVQATYDDGGGMLTQTDPLGNVTSFTYDDNGNLATRTFAPTSATTAYEYDWAGRPVKVTDALGGITTYSYDQDGNLVATTDPDGVTLTHQYDKSNRPTAILDALGHHLYYGYDANGNVTSVKNEIGNTWTTTFDVEGRPLQATDPLGDTTTTAYDADGRVTSVTDPLGNTVTFQYDPAGRLISKTFPDQGVINYGNNANGQPVLLTDPLGRTWGFDYDPDGRVVDWSDPNGQTEYDGHDPLGRLTQKTLRDGTVINYGYDANSHLTSVSMPPGQTITYAYDAAGNPTSITDPSGTTTMTYDKLGRRLTRTDASNKTIAFTYTAAGRVKTMTYPGSNVVTYAYDAAGRLSAISDWRGNQTSFQYDSVNRITQATLPNNTRTSYTYDAAGRVVARVSQTSGGTVLASYTYAYDAAGHITSVQRTEPTTPAFVDSSAKYTYDPVNRVLTANVDGVATTYAFDLKGDLITKTSAAGTTSYTFDALNRLASVSDGTNTTTYTYDGAGNRLAKTFNGATVGYVREGGTIYCTLDGSGNVQSYNVYAGSLLYSLDAAGAIKVYHGDERGSVVAITDASQNVVQSYSYDPYGKVLGASGSLANAFRYVGAYGVMADEDGLYHMQARYYDPDARRFISEDPLGLSAGMNLYGYAGGDPINAIDPQGLDSTLPDGTVVDTDTYNNVVVPTWNAAMDAGERNTGALIDLVKAAIARTQNASAPIVLRRYPLRTLVFRPVSTYSLTNVSIDEIHTQTYGRRFVPISGNGELRIQGSNWGGVTPGKEIADYESQDKFVANYEGVGSALQGGAPVATKVEASDPGLVQRLLTNWRTYVAGAGARLAMQRTLIRVGIKMAAKTLTKDVTAAAVGEWAGPVVLAGEAGWLVGGALQGANWCYDPSTGKYISLEQGQYDTLWRPLIVDPQSNVQLDSSQLSTKYMQELYKEHPEWRDQLNGKPGKRQAR